MNDELLTESLPPIRVSPELRRRLEVIVRKRPGKRSDHMRFAVEQYVAAAEAQMQAEAVDSEARRLLMAERAA